MRDKIRKRVRAKKIRREGFGKHVSDKQLIQFHHDLVEKQRRTRKKRMD